ncbi:MAG: hypothetical protein QOG83_1388 [Alphaproteobacteria bacterium]|nr:hypothetical protein [Alphaproteobacteria bacterium]
MRQVVPKVVDDRAAVPDSRAAAADYIAALLTDLGRLAREHRLDSLGYILEMARLEAETIARPRGGGD